MACNDYWKSELHLLLLLKYNLFIIKIKTHNYTHIFFHVILYLIYLDNILSNNLLVINITSTYAQFYFRREITGTERNDLLLHYNKYYTYKKKVFIDYIFKCKFYNK